MQKHSKIIKETKNPYECAGIKMKVLVVEDNEFSTNLISVMLNSLDIDVDTAKDGHDAILKFERSSKNEYDIIFMDIVMPVLNGNESAATIRMIDREDAKTVPIIAITALNSDKDKEVMLESGMDGILQKPLSVPALKEIIEKYTS